MKKRLMALLLLTGLLSAALTGCGGGSTEQASEDGQTADGSTEARAQANEIVVGIAQDLDESLDPHLAVAAGTKEVMFNVFEGLVKPTPDGDLVPAVADHYEISEDQTTYTFTLREGACWSDGTPVKAEDFITAWTRVISGAVDSPCRYLFDVILGARDYENEESELGLEATEDGKLVVTLEGDYSGFAHMLAAPAFWPIKEGEMAYNGRYALADITENVATLKPNTGYRGEKPAAGLALKYYYGDLAALETLAADGTLQATFGYAGDAITPVTGSNGVTGYYVLNTEKLSEADTRLAVKRLLAGEEGTGPLPENMTLLTLKDAPAVPEALANATNLTVNALDYEDYKAARTAGEYDLLYLAVSLDYPDEAVLLHWFASASESNYAKYNSEEFDEMLSKIDTETEESARIGLVKGAMQLLAEEAVLLPQDTGKTPLYCHASLSGITCDAQGLWNFGDAKYTA